MVKSRVLLFFLALVVLLPVALSLDYTISKMDFVLNDDGSFTVGGDLIVQTQNKTRVYLVGLHENLAISNATLNGKEVPVFLDTNGYYLYINESGRFTLNGKLDIKGKTRLRIPGPISTLYMKTPYYEETYHSVVDKVINFYTYKPPTRPKYVFNIILEKDRKSFYYMIYLEDYQTITLPLLNGEQVTDVSGAKYELKGNTLVLYPRVAQITVKGQLNELDIYRNPKPGYVVIQWEPVLQVNVSTEASLVDESQLPGRYSVFDTQKVYYSSRDTFAISSKKMDMFPGLVFSVSSEAITGAITENGWLVHDSLLGFSNTGLDYLRISIGDWTPLYLGVNGPRYLTRSGKDIYVSVPKTRRGNLKLISLQKMSLGVVSVKQISFPTVSYPISQVNVKLYYPDTYEAIPLDARALHFDWPVELFVILVLSGLALLFIKKKYKALLIGVAIWILLQVSLVFVLLYLGVIAYLGYKKVEKKYIKWIAIGIVGLSVVALLLGGIMFVMSSMSGFHAPGHERVKAAPAPTVSHEVGLASVEVTDRAGYVTEREVLPVELALPRYSKSIRWKYALLNRDEAPGMSILFVHSWVWKLALFILGCAILVLAKREIKGRKWLR
ncbi:MAG: hypothetical protein J7K68_01975 [Candidatus Diapherotrites archaeon]|nr:hypothetical protein [Candidatus Diapherotrites archaeon]